MQLLLPLAVQHVGLAPGHVLDAPGVHQHHLEASLFQHPEQQYPVNAGGLHDHRLHTALRKPVRQAIRVRREGGKFPHRNLRAVLGHRRKVATGPHVDAGCFQVQLGQQLHRFCSTLACAHHSLHAYNVDVSPEGVTNIEQSMERDRSAWSVTNDAVVRLPDHDSSDLWGSTGHPAFCREAAKHGIATAKRFRPLKREQLGLVTEVCHPLPRVLQSRHAITVPESGVGSGHSGQHRTGELSHHDAILVG